MREVHIDDEAIALANVKSQMLGNLNNSITCGEGNLAGFIGEYLVADVYSGEICNTYDYDILIAGLRVDVKTKRTTVRPQPNFLATVAAANTKQQCDVYYFVRVNIEQQLGYLLGGMKKSKFFEHAMFYRKGDLDPSSNLGWRFTADCYNLPVCQLKNV